MTRRIPTRAVTRAALVALSLWASALLLCGQINSGDGHGITPSSGGGSASGGGASPLRHAVIDLGTNATPIRVTTNGWVLLADTIPTNGIAGYRWHAGTLETLTAMESNKAASVSDIAADGRVVGDMMDPEPQRGVVNVLADYYENGADDKWHLTPNDGWNWQSPNLEPRASTWPPGSGTPVTLATPAVISYGELQHQEFSVVPHEAGYAFDGTTQHWMEQRQSRAAVYLEDGSIEGTALVDYAGPSQLPQFTGSVQIPWMSDVARTGVRWTNQGVPPAPLDTCMVILDITPSSVSSKRIYSGYDYSITTPAGRRIPLLARGSNVLYRIVPDYEAEGAFWTWHNTPLFWEPMWNSAGHQLGTTPLDFNARAVSSAGHVVGNWTNGATPGKTVLRMSDGATRTLTNVPYVSSVDTNGQPIFSFADIPPGPLTAGGDILAGTTLWTTNLALHGISAAPDGGWQPIDLRQTLPTNWTLTSTADITDNGLIVGKGHTNGGQDTAILLLPIALVDTKDKILDDLFPQGTTITDAIRDVNIEPKNNADDKNPKSIAWIEPHGSEDTVDAPDMPQLTLRFRGTELMGLKIRWKLKVEYKRPNGRTLNPNEDKVEISQANGWVTEALDGVVELYNNVKWESELEEKGFFGGDAELTFQLLKGDDTALGEETTWKFRIAGKNPNNTKARDYLSTSQPDLWFTYAICKHETAEYRFGGTYYNQFVGNPNGKTLNYTKHNRTFKLAYGAPTWNWDFSDSKPGGFGLFQVTGWKGSGNADIPRDVIWNWQRNMNEGAIEIRRDKVPAATSYFNAVRSKYGPNTPLPPITITGTSRNLTGWEVSVIVRYNGVGSLNFHDELKGLDDTRDPWTYSGGTWYGPKPNKQNYLNQVIPEIE